MAEIVQKSVTKVIKTNGRRAVGKEKPFWGRSLKILMSRKLECNLKKKIIMTVQ